MVVIIIGSKVDIKWAEKIKTVLDIFGIDTVLRVASAHKTPQKCLEILKEYEQKNEVVFITIAGRSNALSGFVDAQTYHPVIACPPYSEKFSGADIYSSLRMPSGVAPMVVLEPEAAAIASAKILALRNPKIRDKIIEYQERLKRKIEEHDKEVKKYWEV